MCTVHWHFASRGVHVTTSTDENLDHETPATVKNTETKLNSATGPGVFGVHLHTSIRYANAAISLYNDENQAYTYGYVPILIAKTGIFLKEKGIHHIPCPQLLYGADTTLGTDVEWIFRTGSSPKRMQELQHTFDNPDRYGKGFDWTGYTVHDGANLLLRYLLQLPESLIPLELYDRFRCPLRSHQAAAIGTMDDQMSCTGDTSDPLAMIETYQTLVLALPPHSRQLFLYLLDLLAAFGSKSNLNKMTIPNLAEVFQPGILSHPQHSSSIVERRLSVDVMIFFIENQDQFLISMPGTISELPSFFTRMRLRILDSLSS